MDVKPSLSNGNGGGNGQPKQREGTNHSGTGSNTTSGSQGGVGGGSNGGSLNGGLFDVASAAAVAAGQHPYNGYENYGAGGDYGGHQSQGNAFQSVVGGGSSAKMSSAMSSPHSKPQRTKSRTNAGKTILGHGVGYFMFTLSFTVSDLIRFLVIFR